MPYLLCLYSMSITLCYHSPPTHSPTLTDAPCLYLYKTLSLLPLSPCYDPLCYSLCFLYVPIITHLLFMVPDYLLFLLFSQQAKLHKLLFTQLVGIDNLFTQLLYSGVQFRDSLQISEHSEARVITPHHSPVLASDFCTLTFW